tara:strand:- start:1061 stop:1978 length:918 start_codon:yes stop_codon:yes gene_type:complete
MVKIVRDKKDLKNGIEIIQDKSKELFKKNSEIKKIFEGCLWAEGPVFLKDENLIVWSDIPFNRMLYFDISNGKTGVFRNHSYFSNGNSVDLNGNQITAEHGRRAISHTNKNGEIKIIVDKFEGKRLNSPNDLVCKSDGTIWFTDPQYGIKTNYEGYQSESEIGFNGVYMIDNNKNLNLLTKEIDGPNGIAFSPDEKTLYVTDTETTGNIFSYKVSENKIFDKQVFATPRPGKPDGIKVDEYGNVFSSAWDGVQIFTPEGDLMAKIQIAEQRTANLCFGGNEFNKLFITSDKSLYTIEMNVKGNQN